VVQYNNAKKYCTIHNTDTVAYTAHTMVATQTERKKEVHQLHTGTHMVHNNYSGTQHSQQCTTHT